MTVSYLAYALVDGYIHNWLVAGPLATPVSDLHACQDADAKLRLAQQCFEPDSGIDQAPLENGALQLDQAETKWSYYHCKEDHLLDFVSPHGACQYLRTWAYTVVDSPMPQAVTLVLTTDGPADMWLNGAHIERRERFYRSPTRASFPAEMVAGRNEILVRIEQVAQRGQSTSLALRIVPAGQPPEGETTVLVPTTISNIERRQALESLFEEIYADRAMFAWDDNVVVRAPRNLKISTDVVVRLQTPPGSIYFESHRLGPGKGHDAPMGRAYQYPAGRFDAFLMPDPREYYEGNMHYDHKVGFWVANGNFHESAYGTYEQRRHEALSSAAARDSGLLSEIAKMALGQWARVEMPVILEAIEQVRRREELSACQLLALLGMMLRYQQEDAFPSDVSDPLASCVRQYDFGLCDVQATAGCIVVTTCELLAGQLYPETTFADGRTGDWHREQAQQKTLAWMHARGATGFPAWDAHQVFEWDLAALSHLADLATDPQVYDLAAVIMDKMLVTMAVNSFKGVFGSSHGSATTSMIISGSLEATSGIARLAWGMGAFNHHLLGVVSLASASDYEVPSHIQAIAMDTPDEIWGRERHGLAATSTPAAGVASTVNKVNYKTPDTMLCSAQDYRPGEAGETEHIWQATLGRDAVVFVNHPANASIEDSQRPAFWCGNGVLPRVAQWKDTLIAVYNLPDDDWMGFTHAFFPTYAFDEYVLKEGWAFARRGSGYLALTCHGGMELTQRGEHAYRELRAWGTQNTWLCHTGRAAQDGDFRAFQTKVLALQTALEPLSVQCATLRGAMLSFGWQGPLLRDGDEEPLDGFMHYDNPYAAAEYPATIMAITYADYLLRLDFTQ